VPGEIHPAIAGPIASLERAGVRWCVLRGEAELHRLAGDVDLLVHPRDLALARICLVETGTFTEIRAWGRHPHHFLSAYIPSERAWLKLDVVTELAFGPHQELRTPTAEAVLARRVRDGVMARLARVDAFWALLLHALLDRGELRPGQRHDLRTLAIQIDRAEGPLAAVVAAACPPGWDTGRIAGAAASGSFGELLSLAPALRAGWPCGTRVGRASRGWVRRALRAADRRLPRREPQQSGRMTSNRRSRSTG
jgi:hypothetical protein